MPGVSIELSSPAHRRDADDLFRHPRAITRFVDLRPGIYALAFALDGFQTVRQEGITLRAAFTATINIALKAASLQESVTVTGVSPLVDCVHQRDGAVDQPGCAREHPHRARHPAGRRARPGVTSTRPDVGGSETHQNTTLSAHGSETRDTSWNSDGLDITGNNGGGGIAVTYFNQAMEEEVSVQSKAAGRRLAAAASSVNMITKDGGNRLFKGQTFFSQTDAALQSNNVSSASQQVRGMGGAGAR